MNNGSPTLLVDVGGTLLTRSAPGPYTRTASWLRTKGFDLDDAARLGLATALLTGADRDAAADIAARDLRLSDTMRRELRDLLGQPDGEAMILPGALHLLSTAVESGWQIVATTNAARWTPALPGQLRGFVSQVISSAELGLVKQDAGFWADALARCGADPHRSLVVGDSTTADHQSPINAGLAAVLVGRSGQPLTGLARWLIAAGPPPTETDAVAAGPALTWAGQAVVDVPHLSGLVRTRTRARVRLTVGSRFAGTGVVVRRRGLSPTLLLPRPARAATAPAPDGLLWLTVIRDRRSTAVPSDLAAALANSGLDVAGLPERDVRHLVSMVHEARNPETRADRIHGIVEFLRQQRSAAAKAPATLPPDRTD